MSKKVNKTVEELLEEAFVHKDKQPHDISVKWKWVKLGNVIELISGRDISSNLCNSDGIGVPYIMGASNIANNSLVIERWIEKPTVKGKKGDILISVKGTIGKLIIQELDTVHLSRQIMALRSKDIIDNKYLFLYMQTYINKLKEVSKGIIPGIARTDILNAPFPLPPLNEQKRIADKVERLLNKIDESKQLIDEVKETFELRRAAILAKAFRGELTADWRDGNRVKDTADTLIESIREKIDNTQIKINTQNIKDVNESDKPFVLPTGWKWVRLGQLAYYVTSGSRDWSKYYSDSGAIFIRTQNINTNKLVLDDVAYMNLPENVEGKRSIVEEGDLLTTITGANVGKCAIVDFDISEAYVSQSVALTKLVDKRLSRYIYMSLISPNGGGGELKDRAYGIGRPVLSLEDIKNIKIPFAPYNEQHEIIRRIEALLLKEEKAIELINLGTRLDQLKNSILSKAFKGELGTNVPSEESAIKLLKEVLNEQVK